MGSTFPSHLHHIRVLQNKMLRVLCGVGFKDSVQKRYIDCKILPLAGIITFYRSLFMLIYFHRPLAIIRRSQFSIRHQGPHAWNCLPTTLRNMDDFREFWRELKLFCLNIYGFDS